MGVVLGEMAQLLKCLLHTHEDLSLIPRSHVNMPGMVAHAYPVILGSWRQDDPWGLLVS